jgi:hypothetical protein
MNLLSTTAPAPLWLRELADARAGYQELVGWPVSVQVGGRNLVVALGGELNAITMPARLGARVRALLDRPAPVFASVGRTHWTFLVGTVAVDNSTIVGSDVEMATPGTYLAIPTQLAGSPWVEPPRPSRPLPPARTVLALAAHPRSGRLLVRSA